jgi:hypothetical protein
MTKEEKEKCNRIETLHGGFKPGCPDEHSMSEFISLTGYLPCSINWDLLRAGFKHFQTLKQQSAKIKSWDELCRHANGVYLESSRSMPCSDRGGSGVQ